MEENIIAEIAQAEEEGAKQKAAAEEHAKLLLADAERQASEILKIAETDCAILRANGMQKAEADASADYERALSLAAKEAKEYAEGLLSHTEVYVAEIVGRIAK